MTGDGLNRGRRGDTLRAMSPDTPQDGARADEEPAAPPESPTIEERRLPIGCHPLVFGVVAATLQMAAILLLLRGCG